MAEWPESHLNHGDEKRPPVPEANWSSPHNNKVEVICRSERSSLGLPKPACNNSILWVHTNFHRSVAAHDNKYIQENSRKPPIMIFSRLKKEKWCWFNASRCIWLLQFVWTIYIWQKCLLEPSPFIRTTQTHSKEYARSEKYVTTAWQMPLTKAKKKGQI
jgi:hypothetical protein